MSLMTSRPYNTRGQNTDNINTSRTTSSVATSENITSLETKLLSRFGEVSNELLNVKDMIIKNTRIFSLNSGPYITRFLAVVAKKPKNLE